MSYIMSYNRRQTKRTVKLLTTMPTITEQSDDARTWTFQPDDSTKSLMKKAMSKALREAKKQGIKLATRGLRTKLLNEAFRAQNKNLIGKREA